MRGWLLDFEEEITEGLKEILNNPEFDHSRISLYVDDSKKYYSICLPISELVFSPEGQPDLDKDNSSRYSHYSCHISETLDARELFQDLYQALI